MWAGHHGTFKLVYKSDTPFLFANGFLLLLVTVVPFPTSLVAQYLIEPYASMACAAYAGRRASMTGKRQGCTIW